MNSLVENLVEFIEVLRLGGVRISISEALDAVNALMYVDLLNRNQVRIALSACLAKGEDEKKIFHRAFEEYFIAPDLKKKLIGERIQRIEEEKSRIMEEAQELKFQDEQLDVSNELKEVYSSLSGEEKQSIRDFLHKTSGGKNVRSEFKPLVQNIINSKLSRLKQKNPGNMRNASSIFDFIPSDAGIIARDITESLNREESLLNKNIGSISDEDMPLVIGLIRQITDRLRKSSSRRYKKSGRRAGLDLKKTIRSNLNTGSVQFQLKYRYKKKKRDKVLLLCDVSSSMYRFSGFVLQFLAGMHSNFYSSDSYIFSEEIEHLNIREFTNVSAFEEKVKTSTVWRKGTHISTVLSSLLESRKAVFGSSTLVIIVSDAKTLEAQKAAQKLKALKAKCKRILWLNPISEKDWNQIAGMDCFLQYCTMLDCSTLQKLSKACQLI